MGMFDYINIEGQKAEKLATYCDIDLTKSMQTKQLHNVLSHYLITDDGLLEREFITQETGETSSYMNYLNERVDYQETRTVGERRRQTFFIGELMFGAYTTEGEWSYFTAEFSKVAQPGGTVFALSDIRPGINENGLHNYGEWEEIYYDTDGQD